MRLAVALTVGCFLGFAGAMVGGIAAQPVAAEGSAVGTYQLQADEGLYVLDTRTGQVLKWDVNREGKRAWLALTRPVQE